MGALPTALLVGLALPGGTAVAWVLDLARGLGEEPPGPVRSSPAATSAARTRS